MVEQADTAAREARIAALIEQSQEELKRIAHARLFRSGHLTLLQTNDLVNEACLRLARAGALEGADRGRFLAYAARTIRSVIVDYVRQRGAARHGGEAIHVTLDTGVAEQVVGEDRLLAIDAALDALRALEPALAQVVEMRFFAGLTEGEIAASLGVSERTVRRHWEKARRLLATMVADGR